MHVLKVHNSSKTLSILSGLSIQLRVVHFRCYIGLKSLIRILRLRIRSETGVDLQKIISERGAHQLHSVVLLIEHSLATLLQLQDTADALRSRVNTFRSDPQFYIRTCSWPRLNDPMGAVWSLPQRSSPWMWPLELWPEGTDGTSRLLHALDLTPSNQRTWTVRKRLLKNSLRTASDLIRLDKNDANPPPHILGTLDANFETYDSELREQLCKAWNLLFGWTWLSISGALTRILPTATKSVVSSIPVSSSDCVFGRGLEHFAEENLCLLSIPRMLIVTGARMPEWLDVLV
ncbi:hypothetical protein FGIG_05371 [Fasciola gigantica]|uniref:Uncharacterized protein n=1 Tax=Fasciola gigantica TaxID=46835 RepID=A0A504YIF3_FASGI|nr:hypothetical protein FGIG_05371 [Fasciola gigantica]